MKYCMGLLAVLVLSPGFAVDFVKIPNAAIYGHNTKKLKNHSVKSCKAACAAETSFECKSFDFHKGKNICDLSDKSAKDVGGLKFNYAGNPYDHYAHIKKDSSSYQGFVDIPKSAIYGHNTKKLTKVNVDDCKRACREEASFVCKSFDFHIDKGVCDLSDKNAAEVPLKFDYPGNPYDHYGRGFPLYGGKINNIRVSQLPIEKRRQIIVDNMPIWIMFSDEEYYPKAFQEYLKHDVKTFSKVKKQELVDLIAYNDLKHQSKNGSRNTVKLKKNLMTDTFHFHDKDKPKRTAKSMDPKAAPTYVFYQETHDNNIWLRYFLFFGYNDVPVSHRILGAHFADWIHIAVKLQPEGEDYIPSSYYFSAHKTGEHIPASSTKLDYYIKTGNNSFKEVEYAEAKQAKQFHVRVFAANGTHEAYAERGYHRRHPFPIAGYDHCDFGGYVVVPFAWEMSTHPRSNSKLKYQPYYAWDMGDLSYTDKKSNINYITLVPNTLFGKKDSYFNIWSHNKSSSLLAIRNSGQKVGTESGGTAEAPVRKIFSWGSNFNN